MYNKLLKKLKNLEKYMSSSSLSFISNLLSTFQSCGGRSWGLGWSFVSDVYHLFLRFFSQHVGWLDVWLTPWLPAQEEGVLFCNTCNKFTSVDFLAGMSKGFLFFQSFSKNKILRIVFGISCYWVLMNIKSFLLSIYKNNLSNWIILISCFRISMQLKTMNWTKF